MKDEVESLNKRIEAMWCEMDGWISPRLFYFDADRLLCACRESNDVPRGAFRIAWFTRSISLLKFRERVFCVFEQIIRDAHRE